MGGIHSARALSGIRPVNTLAGQKRDKRDNPPQDVRPAKKPYTESLLVFNDTHGRPIATALGSIDGSLAAAPQLDRRSGEPPPRGSRRKGKGRWGSGIISGGIEVPHDPISDDRDELSEGNFSKPHGSQRSPPNAGGDAADVHIVSSKSKSRQSVWNPVIDAGSEDELSECPPPRTTTKAARITGKNPARSAAPSTSSRGDIAPTKWLPSTAGGGLPLGLPLKAAFRQPNYRYQCTQDEAGQEKQLFLRTMDDRSGVRAFTAKGEHAADYAWLSISASTKTVIWAPRCCIIKIHQGIESAIAAGALTMLWMHSSEDVYELVQWVKVHLKQTEVQEEKEDKGSKLQSTFNYKDNEVKKKIEADAREKARITYPPTMATNPQNQAARYTGVVEAPPSSSSKPERRPLIRDRMKKGDSEVFEIAEGTPTSARNLRSRRPPAEPIVVRDSTPTPPPRWSAQNTEWRRDWRVPLVFQRTTVDKDDIPRLDEGEYLNDNIIAFGMRYLYEEFRSRHPELKKRALFMNTFFHEKLKSNKSYKGSINYEGVKNWTAKEDLFSYDYIVVPVNEHAHWWVAIICNPGKIDPDARKMPSSSTQGVRDHRVGQASEPGEPQPTLVDSSSSDVEMENGIGRSHRSPNTVAVVELDKSLATSPLRLRDANGSSEFGTDNLGIGEKDTADQSRTRSGRGFASVPKVLDPTEPKIITLDSMSNSHAASVNILKHYLVAEFEDKKKKAIDMTQLPPRMGMKAVHIPEQSNFHDCGVYVLGYVQEFVKHPDQFIQTLLRREKPKWSLDASYLRGCWRETIFTEQKKYQGMHLHNQVSKSLTPVKTTKSETHSRAEKITPGQGGKGAEKRPSSSAAKPSSISPENPLRTDDNNVGLNNGPKSPLVSDRGAIEDEAAELSVSERSVSVLPGPEDDEVSLLTVSKDQPMQSIESKSDVTNGRSQTPQLRHEPIDITSAEESSQSRDDAETQFIGKLASLPAKVMPTKQRAPAGDAKDRILLGDSGFSFPRSTRYDKKLQPSPDHRSLGEGEQSRHFSQKSPASHKPKPLSFLEPSVPIVRDAEMVHQDTIVDLTKD